MTTRPTTSPRGRLLPAATAVALLAALAACSDDDATTAGGDTEPASEQSAACVADAESFLADYDEQPTELPDEFTPLSEAPEPGGKVIVLFNSNVPSDLDVADETLAAAEAIGWTGEKLNHDGSIEDLNAKLMEAVEARPTMIASEIGWEPELVERGIDAARDAGIVLYISGVTTPPISNPGYAASAAGLEDQKELEAVSAHRFLRDSNCNGHVLSLSAAFPILDAGLDEFNRIVAEKCPDCTTEDLDIQLSDIGAPASTNAVISKLQTDPSIKYVHTTFADLAIGLDTGLRQANIEGIKIFGLTPNEQAVAGLKNGTNEGWWVAQSPRVRAWVGFDAGLRAIDGETTALTNAEPFGILTPENVDDLADDGKPPALPTDFRDQFEELWKVG